MATKAEELRKLAQTIKNETQVGGNTAERVGSAFEGVADALDAQSTITESVKKLYAGGIININDRYGINSNTFYSLESAIAKVPLDERTWIKGLLFYKEYTKRPTLAFYIAGYKGGFNDVNNWVEIDIRNITALYNITNNTVRGVVQKPLTLSEAIEKVPLSERFAGKMVIFKNNKSQYALAIFNSDAFTSGWTNENNWAVVDVPNFKFISSIKQAIDDISALQATTNKINENLANKVDKISGKVLSSNDYTNKDKEKLDALSIPTIPDSIIKSAVDGYVEENNADLSLKDKTLNVITNYKYKLEENVLSNPISIGANWSGDMEVGFTHAAGSEESLEFDVSTIPLNSKILIRFEATNVTSNNKDIFVSVGNLPKIKSYNGGTSFKAGVIYAGGTLKFIPTNWYNGIISKIKCQVISDAGAELFVDNQNVIYNTRKDLVYGFWNFFAGGENTALKAQNITRSIAIGNYALQNMTVGNRNVAIGAFALPNAKEGEDNVAIGADTIYPLVKATNCIGIGKGTLGGSKNADSCVAVGAGAMGIWHTDYDRVKCVAVGVDAGIAIAENCTHVGYRSGACVIGKNNTSLGYNSMCVGNITTIDITGEKLVCIGYNSEIDNTVEAKSAVNSMALGADTKITKSNQVVLGNSAVEEVIIAGKKIIFYEDGTVKWENA